MLMSIIILTCDGGSRLNPGPSATGYAVWQSENKIYDPEVLLSLSSEVDPVDYGGSYLGVSTNNQAEWKALLEGLDSVKRRFGCNTEVQAFLDSELVVKQISGQYKVKHPDLIPLSKKLKTLNTELKSISYTHILRKYNKKADSIVNQILDDNQ
ncbi:MAG: ribonuclease HI family protein [Patescibacteria group bacterium]